MMNLTQDSLTYFLAAYNQFQNVEVYIKESNDAIEVWEVSVVPAKLLWELIPNASTGIYEDNFGTGSSEFAVSIWEVPIQAVLYKANQNGNGVERIIDATDIKTWRTANAVAETTPVSYSRIREAEYYRNLRATAT